MKKSLWLAAAALLVIPATTSAFTDVTSETDYSASIEWMNENFVVQGYADGTFKPEACVNRAEFLKMLYLAAPEDMVDTAVADFSDVEAAAWYMPYLKSGVADGIIEGYPDGTFKPGQCVNRVEALKMALEGFNVDLDNSPVLPFWVDLDANAWYNDYFVTAFTKQVVGLNHIGEGENEQGFPTNSFYPAEGMSRAEVAELLFNLKAMTDNKAETYTVDLEIDPIVEGVVTEESLINNYWLGHHVNKGWNFGEDGIAILELQEESDCQSKGPFAVKADYIEITLNECVIAEATVKLKRGQDEKHPQYTEFLMDNSGHKYYNVNSTYPEGTAKKLTLNGKSYTVTTNTADLAVNKDAVLRAEPNLEANYYQSFDFEGRTDTNQWFQESERLDNFVGSIEVEGETWYLIMPMRIILGSGFKYFNAEGSVINEMAYDLPYTWIHESHIAN